MRNLEFAYILQIFNHTMLEIHILGDSIINAVARVI